MSYKKGLYPFWFWNDRLEADEIRWQIKEMANKGIKGFFIHSRQGLQQPYLSKSFFDMVELAINEAEKYGLDVHLYDEYPYPSGVAGGEVIQGNPEFQATKLCQQTITLESGDHTITLDKGNVLNCTAYPLLDDKPQWSAGKDIKEHIGILFQENQYCEMGLTSYNRKRFMASTPIPVLEISFDTPHLVVVSIQAVVEWHKYWNNYVDVLNPEAIKKFIAVTHERYYKHFKDNFSSVIKSIFVDETAPDWSALLIPAFEKKYDYNLTDSLPALACTEHPDHKKLLTDLENLKYEMFCDSFEKPIRNWCQQHGIHYSGEKPGLRFSQLKYMDIPGCEPGHTKAGAVPDFVKASIRGNARTTASAAYFYDKSASLCECYHSMGWSATLQDAKLIADGLLLMGIDLLVPHGFFYSTHGLKKHDAPPSFFFQMPYWNLFNQLTGHIENIAERLEGSFIDADVLVIDSNSGNPPHEMRCTQEALFYSLMEEHIEFMVGDNDILEMGKIINNELHIKDLKIKHILIPPRFSPCPELNKQLTQLHDQGINIISFSENLEKCDIRNILKSNLSPSLDFKLLTGNEDQLYMTRRKNSKGNFWFLVNTGADSVTIEITGECYQISPYESFFIDSKLPVTQPTININLNTDFKVQLEQKNLYRLYDWDMSIDNGQTYTTVPAIPLANQLQKSKLPFPPSVGVHFGHPSSLDFPEFDITYQHEFNNDFNSNIELVMEPESIIGNWIITINQKHKLSSANFAETSTHIRGSLGIDITHLLAKGTNTIMVNVKTDKPDGGLLNCLYLAGEFAVDAKTKTLGQLNAETAFEDYTQLPYYSGSICYSTTFELEDKPNGTITNLAIPEVEQTHDSVEVSINDSHWLPICWQPRTLALNSKHLKQGTNTIKLKIYTALSRSFEGEYFDYEAHKTISISK